jgi:hypothetical protein
MLFIDQVFLMFLKNKVFHELMISYRFDRFVSITINNSVGNIGKLKIDKQNQKKTECSFFFDYFI